jgi:acyl-coenzyme A thioesterase PaaI-like protein
MGDTLVATAQVIRAGKALFRTEIGVHSDDKLVAKANATFMIVSPMADG